MEVILRMKFLIITQLESYLIGSEKMFLSIQDPVCSRRKTLQFEKDLPVFRSLYYLSIIIYPLLFIIYIYLLLFIMGRSDEAAMYTYCL